MQLSPTVASSVLMERNTFFIKQHAALFQAGNTYDVLDPSGGTLLAKVEEVIPNLLVKLLKFTSFKSALPFTVVVKDAAGQTLLVARRPFSLLVSRIVVTDGAGTRMGLYQQRFFSVGGRFDIMNQFDELVGTVKGNWVGWTFTFRDKADQELAVITRSWAGLGKELLTSSDHYVVDIKPSVRTPQLRLLIMAAAFCIDMVFKNESRSPGFSNLLGD